MSYWDFMRNVLVYGVIGLTAFGFLCWLIESIVAKLKNKKNRKDVV